VRRLVRTRGSPFVPFLTPSGCTLEPRPRVLENSCIVFSWFIARGSYRVAIVFRFLLLPYRRSSLHRPWKIPCASFCNASLSLFPLLFFVSQRTTYPSLRITQNHSPCRTPLAVSSPFSPWHQLTVLPYNFLFLFPFGPFAPHGRSFSLFFIFRRGALTQFLRVIGLFPPPQGFPLGRRSLFHLFPALSTLLVASPDGRVLPCIQQTAALFLFSRPSSFTDPVVPDLFFFSLIHVTERRLFLLSPL